MFLRHTVSPSNSFPFFSNFLPLPSTTQTSHLAQSISYTSLHFHRLKTRPCLSFKQSHTEIIKRDTLHHLQPIPFFPNVLHQTQLHRSQNHTLFTVRRVTIPNILSPRTTHSIQRTFSPYFSSEITSVELPSSTHPQPRRRTGTKRCDNAHRSSQHTFTFTAISFRDWNPTESLISIPLLCSNLLTDAATSIPAV